MRAWTVEIDNELMRRVSKWDRRNRNELYALWLLLQEQGPDGFDWDSMERAGCASWNDLQSPCRGVYWTARQARFYRITLQVMPDRTIRVCDAAHGVHPHWR